jgi:lytic murein transglycosylase
MVVSGKTARPKNSLYSFILQQGEIKTENGKAALRGTLSCRVMPWLTALALSWLTVGSEPARSASPVSNQKGDKAPMSWQAFLGTLWPEAQARGISEATFKRIFSTLEPDCAQPSVYCSGTASSGEGFRDFRAKGLPESCFRVTQREFLVPANYFPQTYMNNLAVHAWQLLDGWRKDRPEIYRALRRIETEYGVSLPMLLALWGRETSFGRAPMKYNAVRSLASMAYATVPARREWARKQLLAALKMVDEGYVRFEDFKSSYAGATGLTQVMPDEFMSYGVDGDGDGRKDIWNSIPDALATTANALKAYGWRGDVGIWGYEVRLAEAKPRFDCTLESRTEKKPLGEWVSVYGLRPFSGATGAPKAVKSDALGFVVLPAGARGPAFVATENFEVLRRYNTSDVYALFIGAIADRIGCDRPGRPCPFAGAWPAPDPAADFEFSVENLCRLQIALKEKGFSEAVPDGLFGVQTRIAIGRYQKSLGLKPDCYPSRKIFDALVKGAPASVKPSLSEAAGATGR